MSKGFTCQGCGNLFFQDPKCVTCGAQKLYDSTVKMQGKQIETQAAEIARLRAELATARREGMEKAAQIADATAHANRVEYPEKWKDRPEGIPHDWSVSWETCAETAEEIAAAIRAAAEEGK